jgi:hypothetical protein
MIHDLSGGTMNEARPVLSVFNLSVSPIETVIPSANLPSTPNTASVAIFPATNLGGNTIETAQVVSALDCACIRPAIGMTHAIKAITNQNAIGFIFREAIRIGDERAE